MIAPIGRIDLGDDAVMCGERSATGCSGDRALAMIERRSHRLTGSREIRVLSSTGCITTAFSGDRSGGVAHRQRLTLLPTVPRRVRSTMILLKIRP
jgi:hypothetical protein